MAKVYLALYKGRKTIKTPQDDKNAQGLGFPYHRMGNTQSYRRSIFSL